MFYTMKGCHNLLVKLCIFFITDESAVKEKPPQLELQVSSTGEQEQDSQPENGDPFNVTTPSEEEAKREFVSCRVFLRGPIHY